MLARQVQVFLSYQMEDSTARDYFVSDVIFREPAVRFHDYPVTGSFDANWKERCAELIRECHGTIVLIGDTTFQSAPVAWEIEETIRLGRPIIGVRLFNKEMMEEPSGLDSSTLIPRSDLNSILFRVRTWSARRRD